MPAMQAEITLSKYGYDVVILDAEMEEVADYHAGNSVLDSDPEKSVELDSGFAVHIRDLGKWATCIACDMLEEEEAKHDER